MQFIRKFCQTLLLLTFGFVLVACSASQRVVKTYEGPGLPENQLARLEVREDIKIVEIDGIRQKTYLLDNLALTYSLLPGEHTIVFRYSGIWSRSKRSSDTEESRVDLIESDLRQVRMVFQPDKTYFFSFSEPSNKREAAQLAKQFSAVIVDENSVSVATDSAVGPAAGMGVAQSLPSGSLLQEGNEGGNGKTSPLGNSVVAPGANTARAVVPAATADTAVVASKGDAIQKIAPLKSGFSRLDAIKVLWTKASAEEKKEFLRWAFQ